MKRSVEVLISQEQIKRKRGLPDSFLGIFSGKLM